ncbi:MAG: hypothetical protein PHY86_04460 [Candidatus Gracilibacteria bacterium]|nr:hypothetical protein [Candidatus Gracilibacteria bacterium]
MFGWLTIFTPLLIALPKVRTGLTEEEIIFAESMAHLVQVDGRNIGIGQQLTLLLVADMVVVVAIRLAPHRLMDGQMIPQLAHVNMHLEDAENA